MGPIQGSRVRVFAPALSDAPLVGRLVAFGGDSLVLASTSGRARARIPIGELRQVQVSEGRDRSAWALKGAVGGGVLGFLLGATALRGQGPEAGLARLVASTVGLIMGGPVGAGLGAYLAPEQWRTAYSASDAR